MDFKKMLTVGLTTACFVGASALAASACTTVIVGKKASSDGSTLVSHTCDGSYDPRVQVIPGGIHKKGTMMPIYKGACQDGVYGKTQTKAGEIPQAEKTYTYFHSGYPFMNEKKVIIGEDTFSGRAESENSEGLFMIEQLQVLCLQRAATARDCVKVMGEAAEKYGYADGGETLTIVDGNEGWVFDIVGPGPLWTKDSGTPGAVWAAKRVPDDNVYVSANRSRVSTLDLKDPNTSMASANVISHAVEMGWYDAKKDGEFLFWKAYNPEPYGGPYYQRRREWRAFTMLVPSLEGKLDPYMDPKGKQYEFSYKVDKPISVADIIAVYRDYYQGTPFDMTKGAAAGPFGNPNRYATPASVRPDNAKNLDWERPISVFRCAYSFVGQSRADMPDSVGGLVWFGEDAPYSTVYMPMYSGMTKIAPVVSQGNFNKFDRSSAWWAFDFVSNLADLKFSYIIKDIQAEQSKLEKQFFSQQAEIDKKALALDKESPAKAKAFLTDYANNIYVETTKRWWELGDEILYRYNDGYVNGKNVGYPTEWLESVDFGATQIPPKK